MDAQLKSLQPSPSPSPADAKRSATHSAGRRCRRRPLVGGVELHGARLSSSVFLLQPGPTCRTDGRMSAGCGGGGTLRCKPLRQTERLSSWIHPYGSLYGHGSWVMMGHCNWLSSIVRSHERWCVVAADGQHWLLHACTQELGYTQKRPQEGRRGRPVTPPLWR